MPAPDPKPNAPPPTRPATPREDEQSIKARGSQLYQADRGPAESEPLALEQRRRSQRPFSSYLSATPAAPIPPPARAALVAAGAVVALLLVVAIATFLTRPARPLNPGTGTGTTPAAAPATPATAGTTSPEPGPKPEAAVVVATDPGELGGVTAGVITWFKADAIPGAADGAPVCTWPDSSVAHNKASQANAGACPTFVANAIGGRPAVRFDGNRRTQLAFNRPVQNDFTLLAVFRSNQGTGPGQGWWDCAGIVDGECQGDVDDYGLALSGEGRVVAGTGKPDTSRKSNPGLADGKPHLAAFVRVKDSGHTTLSVDGSVAADGGGAGTQPLIAPKRLVLGSLQTNLNHFTGDLAEVVFYDRSLPAPELQAATDALKAKYRIGTP